MTPPVEQVTPMPCPFCGEHLTVKAGGMFHSDDPERGCPLEGMSWSIDYYLAAWNQRSSDTLVEALRRIADPRNIHFAGDAQVVAREALSSIGEGK